LPFVQFDMRFMQACSVRGPGKFTQVLLRLFESMSICPVRAIRFMTSIRVHFLPSDCSGPPRFQFAGVDVHLEKEAHPSKRPM